MTALNLMQLFSSCMSKQHIFHRNTLAQKLYNNNQRKFCPLKNYPPLLVEGVSFKSRGGVAGLKLKPDCREGLQAPVSIGQAICNEIDTGS